MNPPVGSTRPRILFPVRMRRFVGFVAALVVLGLFVTIALAPPAQAVSYSADEVEFVRLLNEYRISEGLEPLLVSDMLSEAGDRHCSDMAKYGFFDHYTANDSDWFSAGASPWDRMAASGYTFNTSKGENIAAGQDTASHVFQDWKASSGHNANMLSADFQVVGISMVYAADSLYGYYWTTDFGHYVDPTAHELGSTTDTNAESQTPPAAEDAEESSGFTDVDPGNPCFDEIMQLAELGIVSGYDDGCFRPAAPVSRQQLAKMIALATGYEVYPFSATGFDDVEVGLTDGDPLYPAGYIAACFAAGVIEGTAAGSFAPYENVTRAQLITMISRAAPVTQPQAVAEEGSAAAEAGETPFADFSPVHYPWAAHAWAAGLLDGLTGIGQGFDFWADATRAEACLLLSNLLELPGRTAD